MNPDDAENDLVRALMEPLPKTGYLAEAVRHMTGHARHRLPEDFAAACAETTEHFRTVKAPSPHGKTKLLLAALLVTAAGMVALREHERHLVSINRFEKSPRTHAGNPTSAHQEFLETWKPKLLEAVRKARSRLEALE